MSVLTRAITGTTDMLQYRQVVSILTGTKDNLKWCHFNGCDRNVTLSSSGVNLNGCNRHVAFPQMVSVLTSTNDMLHYPHVVSILTGTTDMLHCPQVVSIFPAWLSVCRVRPRTAGRVRGQTDEEVGWPDPGAGNTEERWQTHKKRLCSGGTTDNTRLCWILSVSGYDSYSEE